jgi:hypothetical protein
VNVNLRNQRLLLFEALKETSARLTQREFLQIILLDPHCVNYNADSSWVLLHRKAKDLSPFVFPRGTFADGYTCTTHWVLLYRRLGCVLPQEC